MSTGTGDASATAEKCLASTVGDTHPRGGNEVRLIGESEDVIQSMLLDISRAEEHCHLTYYIVVEDDHGRRVGQALGLGGVNIQGLCSVGHGGATAEVHVLVEEAGPIKPEGLSWMGV